MFLRQLEYLVALAQEQHFSRAARHCNVSQPSLSNAIKQLETEFGTPKEVPPAILASSVVVLRGMPPDSSSTPA